MNGGGKRRLFLWVLVIAILNVTTLLRRHGQVFRDVLRRDKTFSNLQKPTPEKQQYELVNAILASMDNTSLAAEAFPECYDTTTTTMTQQLAKELSQMPWIDMDWNGNNNKAVCGLNKCFLPSHSDPTSGYLVAANVTKVYDNMLKAMWLEQEIHKRYNARVLSLPTERPVMRMASQALLCLLADRVHQPSRRAPAQQSLVFYPNRTLRNDSSHHVGHAIVVVQRVRRVPEPYLLLGLSDYKLASFQAAWPTFATQYIQGQVQAMAFWQQFQAGMNTLRRVCQHYPQLYMDVQVLVDVQGHIYHVDVDRAFQAWPRGARRNSVRRFEPRIQKVLTMVQSLLSLPSETVNTTTATTGVWNSSLVP